MSHHGERGYTKTQKVRQARRERAETVVKTSPYNSLPSPEAKLAYLDEHFPQGASRQRILLNEQIKSKSTKGTQGHRARVGSAA